MNCRHGGCRNDGLVGDFLLLGLVFKFSLFVLTLLDGSQEDHLDHDSL